MPQSVFLRTALDAVRAAEAVINRYYQSNVAVELKADRTPVTVADVEAEQAIHEVISRAFPDHGFYGEETGRSQRDSDYLWLVDPIDGTKSFVRQYPFFSTQIALMHRGALILGVSNAPAFGELAYAERGLGAYLDGVPIRISEIIDLGQGTLSVGNIGTLARDPVRWARTGALVSSVNRFRGYGDFYHYHLLASGRIDLVLESDVNILDIAALSVIVEEAGGVFTQMDGAPVSLETTTVLAGVPGLHAQALHMLD